jgi:hypothetical protein
MAHAQKPDFFFRRNGWVYWNRRGHPFSWLLAAEVCVSAVVMLDKPCSEVVWRVLTTNSITHFPLHFPSCASLFAITFQLDSTMPWRYMGEGDRDLLQRVFNLWIRRWVIRFMLRLFYPQERSLASHKTGGWLWFRAVWKRGGGK